MEWRLNHHLFTTVAEKRFQAFQIPFAGTFGEGTADFMTVFTGNMKRVNRGVGGLFMVLGGALALSTGMDEKA